MNQFVRIAPRRWKTASRTVLILSKNQARKDPPNAYQNHRLVSSSAVIAPGRCQGHLRKAPKALEHRLYFKSVESNSSLDREESDVVGQEEEEVRPSLPPRISTAGKDSISFALERALRLQPDSEWDALIEEDSNRHADKDSDQQTFIPPERMPDGMFGGVEGEVSPIARAFKRKEASNDAWTERLAKIQSTNDLLEASVGSWGPEQWIETEQLLLNFWVKEPSVRAVVLQFALNLRIMKEKDHVRRNSEGTTTQGDDDTTLSAASYMNIDKWFNFQALIQLLANWNLVYVGGQSDILAECSLEPSALLDTVIHVYHGEYGMKLSERILYLIVSAEVAALTPGKRPVLSALILDYAATLVKVGETKCKPKTQLYNLVATAWIRAALGQETIEQLSSVLERMTEAEVKFDRLTYQNAVRREILRGSKEAATKAESILQQMYKQYLGGDEYVQPNPLIFANVVSAWAHSGSKEAGRRAEEIFQQMIMLREQGHVHKGTSFDPLVMNNVLQCWSLSRSADAAVRAENFWRESGVLATNVTYGTLSRLYSEKGDIPSVERLLGEMEDAATSDDHGDSSEVRISKPDCYSYTALLSAYAKSQLKDKQERAEAVLKRLKQKAVVKPNTAVYNAFLSVLSSTKSGFPGKRADEILQEMKTLGARDADVLPDDITTSSLINVWSQHGHGERADKLITSWYDDYMSGKTSVKPDLQAFNTVLAAYSKSKREDATKKAEALFDRMKDISNRGILDIQPDIFTFNTLLACLANSKDNRVTAAEKAEGLLYEMRDLSKGGVQSMQPTSLSFNSVINAWARAGDPIRADMVFNLMCEEFKQGNELAKPTEASFNTRIKAWSFAKRPESPQKAEDIVQQMHDLNSAGVIDAIPGVRTYTALVLCYGLAKVPGGPQRAEAIVHHMDQLYKNGLLHEGPNKYTFATLRKAWITSNEPDKGRRAAAIEREIEKRFGKKSATA